MTAAVAAKALDLLEQRRVFLLPGDRALILGSSDVYEVVATVAGVDCSCVARGICSHAAAAMVCWNEAAQ